MPKNEKQLNKSIAIFQLLLALTDDEHTLDSYEIIDYLLNDYGISAEKHSVLRDLHQLMDLFDTTIDADKYADDLEFKYYVEYDARNSQRGFKITQRPFNLADIEFLLECINSSKSISNQTAETLREKLASMRSVYEKENLLSKGDIYTVGRNRTDNNKLLRMLDTIDSAIRNNHKISFRYKNYAFVNGKVQKIDRRKGKEYQISPFKALMNDGNYYLLGVNEKGEKVIPYRIDRMEGIKELEDKRIGFDEFKKINLSTYTREIFNMFSGRRELVQIRFTNDLLATIIERFDVKEVKPCDDNHFILTTHILVSDQFFSWLCGFKKKAKIIEPPSLKKEFKSFLDDIYSRID